MRRYLIATLLLTLLVATLPAVAQIPDEFTNLKVLPKDISKRELVGMMRGFAGALGVRCAHCHVGPDNLEGMDFATDKRASKVAARKMIEMVAAINGEYLKGLETSSETKVVVECKTCHRGVAIPAQIEDIIADVIEADGFDAGKAKYLEMRESHYGRAAYDFGPPPLNTLSEQLFRSGKQDEAIELTKLNNELHPDYAWSRSLLAGFYRMQGKNDEAIAAFEEALKLEPDNDWVKKQVEALKRNE